MVKLLIRQKLLLVQLDSPYPLFACTHARMWAVREQLLLGLESWGFQKRLCHTVSMKKFGAQLTPYSLP